MISSGRLEELKRLFKEEGLELSDSAVLEVGIWLLERAKSINAEVPREKDSLFQKIITEMGHIRSLYKSKKVRNHAMDK
jgi:hypothetical protein